MVSVKVCSFILFFLVCLLLEVEALADYRCIGGGVLIPASSEKCGTNTHAGFSCENPDYEICNPYIYGVKRDSTPVCFSNATTSKCSSNITTGEDTVFAPVFNRSQAFRNYNREKAHLRRVCQGEAAIDESASSVQSTCGTIQSQVELNQERKLRGFEFSQGFEYQPMEEGPGPVERGRIREEVKNTELAIEQVSRENQSHSISLPATYFRRSNGRIDRQAHRKFIDLYSRFKDKPELRNSQKAMQRALAFFARNKDGIPASCGGDMGEARSPNDGQTYPAIQKIENQKYIVFVDYTIPHPQDRLFILNLETGDIQTSPSSHGYGSDGPGCPEEHKVGHKCRIPVNFGNRYVPPPADGDGQTSRGFYVMQTGYRSGQSTFKGGSPRSRGHNALHLRGLNGGVNDNALKRSVVFHRASYYKNEMSRSAGCPTLQPQLFEDMKAELPGAMLYNHTIEDEERTQPDC